MNCDPSSLASAATCFGCIPPGMQAGVRSYLLCQWVNKPTSTPGCDPLVDDWLARIAAGGASIPNQAIQNAVCQFVLELRTSGLIDSFYAINTIINTGLPDAINTMAYPLIYAVGNGNSPWGSPAPPNAFVSADLDNDGLIGDGAKWMLTGFVPGFSLAQWDSVGLSIYQFSPSNPFPFADEWELSSFDDAVSNTGLQLSTWPPMIIASIGRAGDGLSGVSSGVPETLAFYTYSRTALNQEDIYWANSLIGWNAAGPGVSDQTGIAVGAPEVYFMANNSALFGALEPSFKRVSFASINKGLDAAASQQLFNAVQTLRQNLGGGWW